jgi:DNA-binding helix-hairpin-helix protein with protein kinase domain
MSGVPPFVVEEPSTMPWETETASYLQELSDVQQQLLRVLHQKRRQMVANDVEAMEATQIEEQTLVERLEGLSEARSNLLQQARLNGLPNDSVQSLAMTVDSTGHGSLGKQAKRAKETLRHIQNETLTNFVLAQQTVLHLSQLLQIIATGGKLKPTYEDENASAQGGTLVDQDA